MADKHEFRIITPDRMKTIYFGENYSSWENLYNSAEAVIEEEPEQFEENGKIIGLMKTEIPYNKAIGIMIDEAFLGNKIQKALHESSDYSECLEE